MAQSPKKMGGEPIVQAPFFLVLPREIRNEIYRFAYCDGDAKVKVTSKRHWQARERERRRIKKKAFTAKPFPECPLVKMAVSKQFYAEASDEWFHTVTVVMSWSGIQRNCEGSQFTHLIKKLQSEWQDSIPHGIAQDFPRLRELRLTVCSRALDNFDKVSCVDKFGPDDFGQLPNIHGLVQMLTLQRILLEPGDNPHAKSRKECVRWLKNVSALQKYIDKKISARGPDTGYEVIFSRGILIGLAVLAVLLIGGCGAALFVLYALAWMLWKRCF